MFKSIFSCCFFFFFFNPYLNQVLAFQTSLLLGLLVQLHVRHQDVLLGLLRQAGIGTAVASTFIRPPGPNSPPTVQVDDRDDQRHQEQRRHRDDDQRRQMVSVHWVGERRGHRRGSDSRGNCPSSKEH